VKHARVVLTHKAMARVEFYVIDNEGTGHPGYRVRMFDAEGNPAWWRATSDSGYTWFTRNLLQEHQFLVEQGQLRSARYTIGPLCGPVEITYTLAEVTIKVVDEAGQPLRNYLVRLLRPSGRVLMRGRTRVNGEVIFYVPEGEYYYDVSLYEYHSGQMPLTIGPPVGGPGGVADDTHIEHEVHD
jgi:hypothetical protein